MTFIKKIIFGLLMLSLIPAVSPNVYPASGDELTVSAAISLKNAFEEMGHIFEGRHKGVKMLFNFGASGDLAQQIEAGAPVDIFASAALKDMEDLDHQGLIISGSKINFVGNALVLIVPNNSPFQGQSFQDLKDSRIKRIAIGNPKTVPAGRYAQEVLINLKLWEVLKDKLILAENVRQVLDYVARGECDAGLVYSTDAMTRLKEIKIISTALEGSHRPILYPIGIIQGTKMESLANEFVALVLSNEGKDILKRYGFKNVPGKTK
jgi:molybdate transport system substrate-binding protein